MVNKETRKKKKLRKQRERLKRKELLLKPVTFHLLKMRKLCDISKGQRSCLLCGAYRGSGKSTIVEILQKTYKNHQVCSADNFFSRNGSYDFDINLLGEAHLYCQNLASGACENKKSVVIIDNTNVMRWEMRPYLELAVKHNYVVVMATPKTSWCLNPEELARRNKHGVTVDILKKKAKIFQDTIPLYYGWFLNENDSERLLKMRNEVYEICFAELPCIS